MRRGRLGREALGGAFVALASMQFGGLVVLGKFATDRGVGVPAMLSIRFAIGAVVLGAALAATGQALRPACGEGRRLVALGAAGYAIEAALFFFAVERGTASAVTLLFFTYPVLVTILAVALRLGRPRPAIIAALAASIGGAALIVGSAGGLDISASGVAFALGSAGMFALYLVGIEVGVRETSSLAGALWVSASASAALGLLALLGGGRGPSGAGEWVSVAAMGVFTAGAFFCLFAGLRLLGAVRTSIVAALEPLSTAVLAVIFLGDPVRGRTAAGGALILAGAIVASLTRASRRAPEADAPVP